MPSKPLLSIGIIFKNEIRCLERCLKSFQTLRDALPCQVVMADTGSDDGSRAIAEKYADILFDFPWVGDFSAARNAVMDRCTGEWFLTVDADEWLDKDISQLSAFLRSCREAPGNTCSVVIRNYATELMDWDVMEFTATRMVRLSTGIRYSGTIHEQFDLEPEEKSCILLDKVVLHHDGYVCLNNGSEEGKQKITRNLALIEKDLASNPHDMRRLLQRLDCCGQENEKRLYYVRQAATGIRERWEHWDTYGPLILRHAVEAAMTLHLPETLEWVALAEEIFPDSVFTRIDIQFFAAKYAWEQMDCRETIYRGKQYLQALRDYRSGNFERDDLFAGALHTDQPHVETDLRPVLALAQLYEGFPENALETLQVLDYDTMNVTQTGTVMLVMLRLHSLSLTDTAPLMCTFWEKIRLPKPAKNLAVEREGKLLTLSARYFSEEVRQEERLRMGSPSHPLAYDKDLMSEAEWAVLCKLPVYRHAYTLFLPLAGDCELGTAAAILETWDPEKLKDLFMRIRNVQKLPVSALRHALDCGMAFPIPERTLNLEELDSLAFRLTGSGQADLRQILRQELSTDPQSLCWSRGVILSAIQQFQWNAPSVDTALGRSLVRMFVQIERSFFPLCFAPEVLCSERIFLLPPMHRFGWYCIQAFNTLDAGDKTGYVRLLREGLESCQEAKPIVEFLLGQLEESQKVQPMPELLALAEQVRTLLAQYPADDPAVEALKQSAAYQKVAHLIEGPESGVFGGFAQ